MKVRRQDLCIKLVKWLFVFLKLMSFCSFSCTEKDLTSFIFLFSVATCFISLIHFVDLVKGLNFGVKGKHIQLNNIIKTLENKFTFQLLNFL